MTSKLSKWGNSLGVRLPHYITERTGLVAGDYLYINLTDAGEILIRPVRARDIPAGYLPPGSPQQGTLPPRPVKPVSKW